MDKVYQYPGGLTRKEYDKKLYQTPHRRASILLRASKKRATEKDWDHDLTLEWIRDRIEKGLCEVTNLPFDLAPSKDTHKNPWGPSLDRIDSDGGYTQDNCRIVVAVYNFAANQWGDEVVMQLAEALVSP